MPEAKINTIPGTKKLEIVIAYPGFETPGCTKAASLYSTEAQKAAAILWLNSLGLHRDDTKTELESGKTIKW